MIINFLGMEFCPYIAAERFFFTRSFYADVSVADLERMAGVTEFVEDHIHSLSMN